MSGQNVSVTSRLLVTIEVESGSNWGPTTTVEQVRDQTIRETSNKLRDVFAKSGLRATIVGEPEARVVSFVTK